MALFGLFLSFVRNIRKFVVTSLRFYYFSYDIDKRFLLIQQE